ncbi:E3 ubiquitin-protein ligase DTX4 [Rhinatrema bivittatum]|uniref:E3 ubiquitin-protein ligase DTX4 n=1 Tax=Rhinatrema bivittatum TaxID=194408 RepID=UPI001126D379|nr:E3 ubiquitin-protein ligase DTX4 [Rhinatrema bivittatum]
MLLESAAVVWEWRNERGRWRPYSPLVSHHIESVIGVSSRVPCVALGRVDEALLPYVLDLQSMQQFRQDTGTIRPVQRSYYHPFSAPGRGVVWEWEADGGMWTPYDMEIAVAIQQAFERQQSWIDLTPVGFCYIIDFTTMVQVNCQTQRKRRLRWRLDLAYPLLTGSFPKLQSWLASPGLPSKAAPKQSCACPQCLLVKSLKGSAVSTTGSTPTHPRHRSIVDIKAPSAQTIRSPMQTLATQVSRKQTTRRLTLTAVTPWEAKSEKSRRHLQRIAMAQSRVLIAAGVPTVPVKNVNGSSPVNPALAGITGILMSAAGLPVCLMRPPKLILHPPPVSKSEIKPIPGISSTCRKISRKQTKKGRKPEEVLKKYLQKVQSPLQENCPLCMEHLSSPSGYKRLHPAVKSDLVGRLSRCGHVYHLLCLITMYNTGKKDGSLQCPTCKMIYGVKTGIQPPGKMEYHIIPHSLPGHSDCDTIRIIYSIYSGLQGPEHPNPGKSFSAQGFPRHCYLPDNEQGRKVLRLLLLAWDRRLIFTIGTSSESDTVIWNEIHHKTEFGSNLTGHGYPDPDYLDNVMSELTTQGITEESLQEKD